MRRNHPAAIGFFVEAGGVAGRVPRVYQPAPARIARHPSPSLV